MRLIPRSLFWRLALVLFGGLLTAQLVSLSLHIGERERLLIQSGGMLPAQRVVDTVQLLDATPRGERARLVALFDSPRHGLALDEAPPPDARITPDQPRAQAFLTYLREQLGSEREIVLTRVQAPPFRAPGMHPYMHPDGPPFGPPGFGPGERVLLTTYVRLADGQWLRMGAALSRPPADLPRRLTLTLVVLFGGVLLLTLLAVRWVTRPLNRLADAADDLGRNLHRPPLTEDGPTESRRAAAAFNRMQTQLIRTLDERTRLLAALSHDLKTPITRMRLRADLLADDDTRSRFEHDLHEMEAMVRDTLDFMRGLDPKEQRQSVDLDALLASLADDAHAMGRDVTVSGSAGRPITAVPRLLRRCLANLIDNAVTYGGRARIAVSRDADGVSVRIADDGPGIPPESLEKVFEPFHRLDPSRNRETGGTGLGLPIARTIAEFHGGTLVLANRLNGGLDAMLRIPS